MGHEMGHYVLGHVPKTVAFLALLILLTLYLAHRTAGFFFARFAARMGFDSLADIAALPLLILLSMPRVPRTRSLMPETRAGCWRLQSAALGTEAGVPLVRTARN